MTTSSKAKGLNIKVWLDTGMSRLLFSRLNLNLLKSDWKRKGNRAKVGEFSPFSAWEKKTTRALQHTGEWNFFLTEFVVVTKRTWKYIVVEGMLGFFSWERTRLLRWGVYLGLQVEGAKWEETFIWWFLYISSSEFWLSIRKRGWIFLPYSFRGDMLWESLCFGIIRGCFVKPFDLAGSLGLLSIQE